jgi:acyl-CoA dehydrogenase
MDFDIPQDIQELLGRLDKFIDEVIKPLEQQDDNIRFFDHRREDARTDWERGGLPNEEWEQLLHKAKRLADEAGFYRYPLPKEYGGMEGRTSAWPSSASIWRSKAWGCTTTCRTSIPSSATTSACC